MIIMGIDPGTAATGCAVLQINNEVKLPLILEYACIKTSPEMEMHNRLLSLHNELLSITQKFTPEIMVVEKLFFNTNAKTAMSVGQARGIPLLIAAREKIKVYEYTALEAKLVLTGYGRADKKQLQEAIREYFGLNEIIKPDDANDALAIALCFLEKNGLNEVIKKTKSSKNSRKNIR